MADSIRLVEYFYVTTPNKPGVGASMLGELRRAGVNLLAFSGFPSGRGAQIDFVPENAAAFRAAAKQAKWKLTGPKRAFLIGGDDRPGAVAEFMQKLADALRIARAAGWDGVELRRLDFRRAEESGQPADSVLDLVRASGLPVACVGVELGWMWADGAERRRLLNVFDEQCRRAALLGCDTVMSPVDKERGDVARAAASIREVGDLATVHGVRLALEFNSQCAQLNTLASVREVLARAGHRRVGLLLDTYHLGRSGATLGDMDDVKPAEIVYVQYSDPPRTGLEPGKALDRLPPGHGSYPFREFFALLAAKGYAGFASYEAPNEAAWKRDPTDVAREAFEATRAVLPA